MKTFLISVAVLFAININIFSQNLIVVQNGSNLSFYERIDSAIVHSNNGDTIYLPGMIQTVTFLRINKKLTILGAGHNPDSTTATNYSKIIGPIQFVNGSNYSMLSGIYCDDIQFGTDSTNSAVNNISIIRCNLNNISFFLGGAACNFNQTAIVTSIGPASNNRFIGNIVRGNVNLGFTANNQVLNNIITGQSVYFGNNNLISNNIFLYHGFNTMCGFNTCTFPIGASNNSTIQNNIFISTGTATSIGANFVCVHYTSTSMYLGPDGCSFNNNIFCSADPGISSCGTCFSSGNYLSVIPTNIFVNQSGNTFGYTQNYHLQNAPSFSGTDATQVGIYGGLFPWKEGSVPVNPHIQFKNIGSSTDPNGNLQLNIRVKAQNN